MTAAYVMSSGWYCSDCGKRLKGRATSRCAACRLAAPPPTVLRLLERDLPFDVCWPWPGGLKASGYGRVYRLGRRYSAHRFVYELIVGEIPADLQLDHLCRNRACCNPLHLEPVTSRENTRRSPIAPATINASKTECHRGHKFDEANTYINPDGRRRCRECAKDSCRRYKRAGRN